MGGNVDRHLRCKAFQRWQGGGDESPRAAAEDDNRDLFDARPETEYEKIRFVSAGAGSGKTYRLTVELERALTERGIEPSRVIATTFTVKAASELSDRVAVGIDARNGRVTVSGWEAGTDVAAVDLAVRVRDMGVRTVIFTDVETDGTLEGPNLKALSAMRAVTGLTLIASGGIGTLEHLKLVSACGADGCIVGTALYEGNFSLAEALAC